MATDLAQAHLSRRVEHERAAHHEEHGDGPAGERDEGHALCRKQPGRDGGGALVDGAGHDGMQQDDGHRPKCTEPVEIGDVTGTGDHHLACRSLLARRCRHERTL